MTDDPRDPRMAERLRVEPLDDVTRARLVRTAMAAAETAPPDHAKRASRGRILGIAAALVVLLAVGFAVLVRNDDSGTGPTAADAPKVAEAGRDRSRSTAADELESRLNSGFSATIATHGDLGALGDVGSEAKVRRAVAAAERPTANSPAEAERSSGAPSATATPLSTTCATTELDRLGAVVAVGTGTADGEPVTVYVVERGNGSRVAVVVGADCVAGDPVRL